MKRSAMVMLTVIGCVTALFSNAQTVEELQAKYTAALGGKEKIISLKNVFQEASMEIMSMQMPAKMWVVYGEGMRQEVEIQGQKIVTFMGKDKGWMINPLMGSTDPQPLPEEAVKSAAGALNPGGELLDYKTNGYTATFEGKDTVKGKDAYKIKLIKGDYSNLIFLDASTYYMVRSISKTTVGGQAVEQTTDLADYKKTPEGYIFPYSSVITNAMVGEIKASVTKIEVNKAVDMKELEKAN